MADQQSHITVYYTTWCYDCRQVRKFFDDRQIPYVGIDIDEDAEASKYVKKVNRGNCSVPTIIFPDGTILVEPSILELAEKLGI
ncbi:MAG: NrdH-redoxin [Chloroflexi bacterium RBG_13_56_8]|nr:MAG: NrdH-redoxin [Chloroflexi bacterium RBG_13_56_8]